MNLGKQEILITLNEQNIPFVIIGGMAMRFYNSPRVTQDLDLAVRAIDIDKLVRVMYSTGDILILKVNDEDVDTAPKINTALVKASHIL